MMIGERSAEDLKINIGTAFPPRAGCNHGGKG